MSNNHYSDNELHLMSYQDLRRLSILLQLPANIKKKYMISMIQAHQRGDGFMKTAIANKVMEERKVKRLNSKKKQTKACMMSSPADSQQIPTDLSVSTQHEFQTRFSYVAHYSSKDEISSGISRIIKQEAEVSRRNRSILQQPRKPTRKLSTVGRTEIMLPRNHSLTTPVRLMPQYERGFPSPTDYETMSGLSIPKTHFQDLSYNYHFHGEFSNALMPTSSHELYRSEPYWHTNFQRDVYNNPLMPILSNLLTSNSVTINSSSYTSQYTSSSNSYKGPTSFQGVYENYIKSSSIIENQAFQASVTNTSTLIVNNHQVFNENSGSNYSANRGSYLITKGDTDYLGSSHNEMNCQHCYNREDATTRNTHDNSTYLEFYPTRNTEQTKNPSPVYDSNVRDLTQYSNSYYRGGDKDMALVPHHPYESSSTVPYKSGEVDETDVVSNNESELPTFEDYESSYTEEDKLWEEPENGFKKFKGKEHVQRKNHGFLRSQNPGPFVPDVPDTLVTFSTEGEFPGRTSKTTGKEIVHYKPNFSRCRYTLGHNKYPEAVSVSNKETNLPSFLSTFCTNELYNKAYSVCKNSFTGTTETHLNPIMTCTYASQFSSHANSQTQANNSGNGMQRQWHYAYSEPQTACTSTSSSCSAWNEYSNEMDNKIIVQSNNHNIQMVKCRTHGCHYVYSVSNPCN